MAYICELWFVTLKLVALLSIRSIRSHCLHCNWGDFSIKMPYTCYCVPGWSNKGGHYFPKDMKLRKKWIFSIRRNSSEQKYKLWETSVVCREHFLPSDYVGETVFGTSNFINIFTLLFSSNANNSHSKWLILYCNYK